MEPRVLEHHVAGEGDPLVLVPGGLTGWLSWIPHQERLMGHHRVIRVQPIHNELGSAGQPGDPGYSAEIERESLRLTLDHLDIDTADFAGWSSGARALIGFTLSHPDRVRSLALVEPPAYWLLYEAGEADKRLEEVEEFLSGLAGQEVTEEDLLRFLAAAGFGSDPAEIRRAAAWETWLSHRMALSWQGFIGGDAPKGDVSAMTCPVLLVKGTVSVPWEKQVVDLLGKRIPNARVIELEGDHAAHIQSIDRFLEELETHLH